MFLLLVALLTRSIRSGDDNIPSILKLTLPFLSSVTLSCRPSKDTSAHASEFLFNVTVVFWFCFAQNFVPWKWPPPCICCFFTSTSYVWPEDFPEFFIALAFGSLRPIKTWFLRGISQYVLIISMHTVVILCRIVDLLQVQAIIYSALTFHLLMLP